MPNLTRRRLLSLTANVISVGAIAGPFLPGLVTAADSQKASGVDLDALTTLAHDLFPHDAISRDVYRSIAGTIIAQEQGSTGNLDLIAGGLQQLNALSGGGEWDSLDEETRIQTLKKLQSTRFFNFILVQVREPLYLRPEVWQLVGYGGNALAHGGYLTHGFNDINWLN